MAKKTRAPSTARGLATRERLLAAAQEVFAEGGYHRASVSAICRRAGVALGTFYQYFADKEAIFSELVARASMALQVDLTHALRSEGDLRAHLDRILTTFFAFIRHHRASYRIFREIEFVNKQMHHQFYDGLIALVREFLSEQRRQGQIRALDPEVAAVALIGVAYFLTLRWLILGPGEVPESVRHTAIEFLLHGMDTGRPITTPPQRATVAAALGEGAPSPAPTRGELSRRKLLQAAKACFSRKGFYATSIAEITRRAGVSLGAFYLYFSSKTQILDELVRDLNAQLRRNARAAIAGLTDRREIEREGFRAFFQFIHRNREAYRIVREAEFVSPPTARWYFERLAQGYVRGLQEGMRRGEIRPLDAETLAYSLMGIGHFLGLRWVVWSSRPSLPKRVFDHALDMILRGLKGLPS
ncbi:MAG: TetR/AcrR family transcriptional regulator [Blastocatellia bacterium]|nr:TetR/AcrR family transcriptional regulator [Blastocatellia bacterium]MCX7752501.1 TetR/AcrR family transcriptional regulator [Blastocatellia bacterium]